MRTETDFVRHEKFVLIQEISRILRDAPQPVRRAWREGWTDIELYPHGYHTMDSCECCFEGHPAGWYGMCPVSVQMRNTLIIGISEWRFICDQKGGQNREATKATRSVIPYGDYSHEFHIGRFFLRLLPLKK